MREIKFRAWDNLVQKYCKDSGEEVLSISLDGHAVKSIMGIAPYDSGTYFVDSPADEPRYLFEQFTGLRDKIGTEIYEGDIVSPVTSLEGGVNGMAVVKYEGGGFSPFAVSGWEIVARPREVTVIGTIREHPQMGEEAGELK